MSESLKKVGIMAKKIKAGVDKTLKLGEKVINDQLRKAQSTITVVYDGKAPFTAAQCIYEYIKSLGYPARLIDADKYAEGGLEISFGRVIIIGHHALAKKQLQCIRFLQYDNYGMKFGYCGNQCVLRASRSALGHGKKGRKQFAEYYNSRMLFHKGLASKYETPMLFGTRYETRKSQYDLLWLEFVTYGLSEFLADKPSGENALAADADKIAEKAAMNLISKLEAEKDMTISLGPI